MLLVFRNVCYIPNKSSDTNSVLKNPQLTSDTEAQLLPLSCQQFSFGSFYCFFLQFVGQPDKEGYVCDI